MILLYQDEEEEIGVSKMTFSTQELNSQFARLGMMTRALLSVVENDFDVLKS